MKCFLYIINNQNCKFYIGITQLLPEVRLIRHNRGDVKSTTSGIPWELIYYEPYNSYKAARIREKQIKSWHSGNAFRKLIATAAGSSNGRTRDFGSRYLGSNPSPAAVVMSNKFGGVK